MDGGMEGSFLAERIDDPPRRRRASVHEGQDLRPLSQPSLLLPQTSRLASGRALLLDHGRTADDGDPVAGGALDDWRRALLARTRAIDAAETVRAVTPRARRRISPIRADGHSRDRRSRLRWIDRGLGASSAAKQRRQPRRVFGV